MAARLDGRLVGVAPMASRNGRLASQSNWHTPQFGLVVEETAAPAVAEALFEGRPRRVSVSFVDRAAAGSVALEEAAASRGYRLLGRPLERSPYIDLDDDWETYEAGLETKFVAELRRRRRRLEERGTVALEVADGTDRREELLDEGFGVEAAGWKGERGSAVISERATHDFYRSVAAWAAANGWLRLAFLRLDSRAIAFDYSIEQGGVHYLLKTGFDPAYAAYGPGIMLRREMLARAFAAGVRSYEFLGADADWKLTWTRTVRERFLIQAFAPSLPGVVEWAAFAYGRPLVKRLLARIGK